MEPPKPSTTKSISWNGLPDDSESSGWHWIEDADGLRPLLWRGSDWPERLDRGEWQDGYAVLSACDLSRGQYHGPVVIAPRLAGIFRLLTLEGAPNKAKAAVSRSVATERKARTGF